jgi:transposase
MKTALENLSKLELITLIMSKEQAMESQGQVLKSKEENIQKQEQVIEQKQADIAYYKAQIAQLQRMLFGQKRERFESESKQIPLPFELEEQQLKQQEEQLSENISYVRKKQSAHKGRLALPSHLPVEEVEIHPQGDLSEMVCIGYAPDELHVGFEVLRI